MVFDYSEIMGRSIEADDGPVGEIRGVVIDESRWTVPFLLVDVSDWLPGGRAAIATGTIDSHTDAPNHLRCSLSREYMKATLSRAKTEAAVRQKEAQELGRSGEAPDWVLGEDAGALLIWLGDADSAETCYLPLFRDRCLEASDDRRCARCLNLSGAHHFIGLTAVNSGKPVGEVQDFKIALPAWRVTRLGIDSRENEEEVRRFAAVAEDTSIDWDRRRVNVLLKG